MRANSRPNVEEFSKSVQTVGVPLPWLARKYRRTPTRGSCEVDHEPFLARRQMEASKLADLNTHWNRSQRVGRDVRVEHEVK